MSYKMASKSVSLIIETRLLFLNCFPSEKKWFSNQTSMVCIKVISYSKYCILMGLYNLLIKDFSFMNLTFCPILLVIGLIKLMKNRTEKISSKISTIDPQNPLKDLMCNPWRKWFDNYLDFFQDFFFLRTRKLKFIYSSKVQP